MKKLASILGIGAISMAVALAPAFAQQTKPQEPAGTKTTATSTSGKSMGHVKTDKDKSTPAVTGSDVKSETVPVKPAQDVKAGKTPAKTGTAAKNRKGTNVKPGVNMKSDRPAKSNVHSKAVATPKHLVKKSSRNPA